MSIPNALVTKPGPEANLSFFLGIKTALINTPLANFLYQLLHLDNDEYHKICKHKMSLGYQIMIHWIEFFFGSHDMLLLPVSKLQFQQ